MLSDLAEQQREEDRIKQEEKRKVYQEKTKNYRPKEKGSLYDSISEINAAELFQINR
jgi:hypothetical protein